MATFSFASHIRAVGGESYKRPLANSNGPSLPAQKLARPDGGLRDTSPFPATAARPTQSVNVRVPVSRACYSRLYPGQVAFVARHYRRGGHGPATYGLGGLTPVVSLQELNDMLEQPHNYISGTAADFFVKARAKSLYKKTGGTYAQFQFKAFNFTGTGTKVPSEHPVMQFALDGLVATRVEDADDLNTGSMGSAMACTVGVKGHTPFLMNQYHEDTIRDVRGTRSSMAHQPDDCFVKPARMLAKLYVVLVLVKAKDEPKTPPNKKKWFFRYEVVSSSNLDTKKEYETPGTPLFTSKMKFAVAGAVAGNKLVVQCMELGTVVDTAFGPRESPQLVVCVNIKPYEKVTAKRSSPSDPLIFKPEDVFKTFSDKKSLGFLTKERAAELASSTPSGSTLLRKPDQGPQRQLYPGRFVVNGLKVSDSVTAADLLNITTLIQNLSKTVHDQSKAVIDTITNDKHIEAVAQKTSEAIAAASQEASKANLLVVGVDDDDAVAIVSKMIQVTLQDLIERDAIDGVNQATLEFDDTRKFSLINKAIDQLVDDNKIDLDELFKAQSEGNLNVLFDHSVSFSRASLETIKGILQSSLPPNAVTVDNEFIKVVEKYVGELQTELEAAEQTEGSKIAKAALMPSNLRRTSLEAAGFELFGLDSVKQKVLQTGLVALPDFSKRQRAYAVASKVAISVFVDSLFEREERAEDLKKKERTLMKQREQIQLLIKAIDEGSKQDGDRALNSLRKSASDFAEATDPLTGALES